MTKQRMPQALGHLQGGRRVASSAAARSAAARSAAAAAPPPQRASASRSRKYDNLIPSVRFSAPSDPKPRRAPRHAGRRGKSSPRGERWRTPGRTEGHLQAHEAFEPASERFQLCMDAVVNGHGDVFTARLTAQCSQRLLLLDAFQDAWVHDYRKKIRWDDAQQAICGRRSSIDRASG